MKPGRAGVALATAVGAATGRPFRWVSEEPVAGGCIHSALRLSGEDGAGSVEYFAKMSEADRAPMFAAEADGLAALREAHAVTVPGVVAQGDDGERAWLVLEWLELSSLDAAAGARLGSALAQLHRIPRERFGWAGNNFIGASPQPNGWNDEWLPFWRERRLMPQLRYAVKNRLPSRMIDRGERLAADCEAFFSGHRPDRSLLHGDLWNGNVAKLPDGRPVLFDPAVYVGDREADVAMTELFGGFPPDFGSAYRESWPLPDNYRVRRDFYNLYHVLNHANLFAGGYVGQAEKSIERLLAEIR
ncbi:MAG: fructosamine kinase family protein [Usitatibacter sp.]